MKLKDDGFSGSPPRVRGAVRTCVRRIPERGITPACAGSRFDKRAIFISVKDHPRVCGEQAIAGVSEIDYSGSPPRVRGADFSQIVA